MQQDCYQARFEAAFVNAAKTSFTDQISLPEILSGKSKFFEGEATGSIALGRIPFLSLRSHSTTSLLYAYYKTQKTENQQDKTP